MSWTDPASIHALVRWAGKPLTTREIAAQTGQTPAAAIAVLMRLRRSGHVRPLNARCNRTWIPGRIDSPKRRLCVKSLANLDCAPTRANALRFGSCKDAVLAALTKGPMTARELAESTAAKRKRVQGACCELAANGLIEPHAFAAYRAIVWKLKPQFLPIE